MSFVYVSMKNSYKIKVLNVKPLY